MNVDLSIIVVNWNVAALLRRCLASCFAQSGGLSIEVIVVDNASADGSVALVRDEFSAAWLIVNPDNRGFSAGVNQGIAASSGRYVMLLNPDAELAANSAATLVGYLDEHPDAGVVGPRLIHADGAWQSSPRRFPTFLTMMLESTPLQAVVERLPLLRRYYMEDESNTAAHEADWLVGACLVVRRTAIEQTGAMDAGFFMYSEELDWCQRIRRAGWRVVYLPQTTVVHHEGQSAAQASGRRAINFNISKVRYWAKWHGVRQARLLRGWLRLLYVAQMGNETAKWLLGHKRPLRAARIAAYMQLLGNGLRCYVRPAAAPKLALLTAEYRPQPGGVGDYTHELAQALDAMVLVVGDKSKKPLPSGETPCGFPVGRFGEGRTSPSTNAEDHLPADNLQSAICNLQSGPGWAMLRTVQRALLHQKIDALNIQYQTGAYRMHLAVNFLPLYLKLRGNPARVVVTFHDLLLPYLFPKAGPVRRLANWLLLKFSDAAIVTNTEDAIAVAGWSDKVGVIPIGSNIAVAPPDDYSRDMWRREHQIASDETLIAYFGLLNQSKGLDTLLQALATLPPRFKLAIIGGGVGSSDPTNRRFAAQIEAEIERLGLGQRIIRSGQVSEREVSAWLCGADVAALPFRDGATLRRGSLLAALAHGLPTVSTTAPQRTPTPNPSRREGSDADPSRWEGSDADPSRREGSDADPSRWEGSDAGLPELKDGDNLLLVPPDDAAALAIALTHLADDAVLRTRLSNGARQLAAAVGWERIAEQVRAVMKG